MHLSKNFISIYLSFLFYILKPSILPNPQIIYPPLTPPIP
nr:MAG TPA: hypothetical protein [Caudoviricetes sp.]